MDLTVLDLAVEQALQVKAMEAVESKLGQSDYSPHELPAVDACFKFVLALISVLRHERRQRNLKEAVVVHSCSKPADESAC